MNFEMGGDLVCADSSGDGYYEWHMCHESIDEDYIDDGLEGYNCDGDDGDWN